MHGGEDPRLLQSRPRVRDPNPKWMWLGLPSGNRRSALGTPEPLALKTERNGHCTPSARPPSPARTATPCFLSASKNTRSEAESVRLRCMAFGQQSGPPATARQIKELLNLLNEAGHSDFRDARGPMGFTQRQAAGRFTRDEAQTFIEALEESESKSETAAIAPDWRQSAQEQLIRHLPAEQLAAELRRRGWTVAEP